MPLTPELLDKLNQALIDRSVSEGFALLRRRTMRTTKITRMRATAANAIKSMVIERYTTRSLTNYHPGYDSPSVTSSVVLFFYNLCM